MSFSGLQLQPLRGLEGSWGNSGMTPFFSSQTDSRLLVADVTAPPLTRLRRLLRLPPHIGAFRPAALFDSCMPFYLLLFTVWKKFAWQQDQGEVGFLCCRMISNEGKGLAATKRRTPEGWRQERSQTIWRQIKGRDVDNFLFILYIYKMPGYLENTELCCVCLNKSWRVWENQEESSRATWAQTAKVAVNSFQCFCAYQISQGSHCSQCTTYSRWVSVNSKHSLPCGSLFQLVPEHKQTEPLAISLMLNRTGTVAQKAAGALWEALQPRWNFKDNLLRNSKSRWTRITPFSQVFVSLQNLWILFPPLTLISSDWPLHAGGRSLLTFYIFLLRANLLQQSVCPQVLCLTVLRVNACFCSAELPLCWRSVCSLWTLSWIHYSFCHWLGWGENKEKVWNSSIMSTHVASL